MPNRASISRAKAHHVIAYSLGGAAPTPPPTQRELGGRPLATHHRHGSSNTHKAPAVSRKATLGRLDHGRQVFKRPQTRNLGLDVSDLGGAHLREATPNSRGLNTFGAAAKPRRLHLANLQNEGPQIRRIAKICDPVCDLLSIFGRPPQTAVANLLCLAPGCLLTSSVARVVS